VSSTEELLKDDNLLETPIYSDIAFRGLRLVDKGVTTNINFRFPTARLYVPFLKSFHSFTIIYHSRDANSILLQHQIYQIQVRWLSPLQIFYLFIFCDRNWSSYSRCVKCISYRTASDYSDSSATAKSDPYVSTPAQFTDFADFAPRSSFKARYS
jgi:hypothetical protein